MSEMFDDIPKSSYWSVFLEHSVDLVMEWEQDYKVYESDGSRQASLSHENGFGAELNVSDGQAAQSGTCKWTGQWDA